VKEVSQTRFPNADCPVCRRQIGPDAPVRSCLICELTYHQGCWERNRGCTTPGCRSREAEPTTGAPATSPPRERPGAESCGPAEAADRALADRPAQAPRKRADWTGPWLRALAAVAVACIVLTIIVGAVATKRKLARRELTALIETARAKEDPQVVVVALEQYLQSDRSPRLVRLATEELDKARRAVDDRDYQSACALDRGERTNLDRLEAALTAYLDKHPNGAYRPEAEERRLHIPDERDDRAYRRASGNAEAAGDDFGLQEAAWQAYLDAYPHGRHATQARVEIARIPDQADQTRLQEVLGEVEDLVRANRLTDALNHIDVGLTEVRSPVRHERLAQRAGEIEAELETLDAAECLKPADRSALGRRSKLGQCRLYLLCYPDGARRAEVEEQVRRLLVRERDELLHELRQRLAALTGDPRAALEALHEFLEHPAAQRADVSRELARYHLELLCQSVADSLREMKVVTLKGGLEIVGEVRPASQGWVQIKPRSTSVSGPRKSALARDTDVVIADPPLLEECPRLRQRVLAMLADSDVDNANVAQEIRVARDLARGDEYQPERLAFQACLAGIDPTDDEPRRELADAGYVKRGGVYTPTAELSDVTAADSPHRKTLGYYTTVIQSSAPLQEMRELLPDSFDYSFLGTMLSVPIEWQLSQPECQGTLLSGEDDPFHGRVALIYPATATRTSDKDLPGSILGELDKELASRGASTRVEVECEVRASPQHLTGVGIDVHNQGDALLVSHVFPESSAALAGVEPGDRVVLVDGLAVPPDATNESLATMIANAPHVGVKLVFVRNGRRFRLTLERAAYTVQRFEMQMTITARGELVDTEQPRVSEWTTIPPPP